MSTVAPISLGMTAITPHLVCRGAVEAGARITIPVADMFWGDRYGQLEDPFGHRWSVATHIRDLSQEEVTAAAAKGCPGNKP